MAHLTEMGDTVDGVDMARSVELRPDLGLLVGPDLLDPGAWLDFVGDLRPDVVYHLAGWSDVGRSWQDPRTAWRVNTEGVLSVLDAARSHDVSRVVIISSADVYGVVRPDQLPLTESTAAEPRSPYGASKVGAETLARQYHRGWGLDVVIARPFNHIGPGQTPNFVAPAFALRIAECELAGGGTVTHGDLSSRRDFTDVRDVVRAYRMLAVGGRPGETYNICTGVDVGMQELLDRLVHMARVPITSSVNPDLLRPVELPVLRGSHDRLTAHTGWMPTIALEQTLLDVLADARRTVGAPS